MHYAIPSSPTLEGVAPEAVVNVVCLCVCGRVRGVASVSIVYLEARAVSAVNVYVYSPILAIISPSAIPPPQLKHHESYR